MVISQNKISINIDYKCFLWFETLKWLNVDVMMVKQNVQYTVIMMSEYF